MNEAERLHTVKKAIILYDKKPINQEVVDERKFKLSTKDTVKDVSRLLHYDHIFVAGIKPNILQDRQNTIEEAHASLRRIQREHDNLCTRTIQRQNYLTKILDTISSLKNIVNADTETKSAAQVIHKSLLDQIDEIEQLVSKEKKLYFMFEHMRVRTRDDIVDIKAIRTNMMANIEKYKSELSIHHSTLRGIMSEISLLQQQYNATVEQIDSREEQREEQLISLQRLKSQDEESLKILQNQLETKNVKTVGITSKLVPCQPNKIPKPSFSRPSPHKSASVNKSHNSETNNCHLLEIESLSAEEKLNELKKIDAAVTLKIEEEERIKAELDKSLHARLAADGNISTVDQSTRYKLQSDKVILTTRRLKVARVREDILKASLASIQSVMDRCIRKINGRDNGEHETDDDADPTHVLTRRSSYFKSNMYMMMLPESIRDLERNLSILIREINTCIEKENNTKLVPSDVKCITVGSIKALARNTEELIMIEDSSSANSSRLQTSRDHLDASSSSSMQGSNSKIGDNLKDLLESPEWSSLQRQQYLNLLKAKPSQDPSNVRVPSAIVTSASPLTLHNMNHGTNHRHQHGHHGTNFLYQHHTSNGTNHEDAQKSTALLQRDECFGQHDDDSVFADSDTALATATKGATILTLDRSTVKNISKHIIDRNISQIRRKLNKQLLKKRKAILKPVQTPDSDSDVD